MAINAQFIATPRAAVGNISTANTNFDGSGAGMVTVFTAGAAGARIESVAIQSTGTTTAGLVNIFVGTDAAANTATNVHIYDQAAVTAVTPSTTVAPFTAVRGPNTNADKWPLILGPGQTLRASTTIAQSFRVVAIGGDY